MMTRMSISFRAKLKIKRGVLVIDTLFFTIVNRGKANAILREAKDCGATGGTILLGEGTVQSKLLDKLGLNETHKEILMVAGSEELCEKLHERISTHFDFSKRNNGIAFSIPFKRWQLQDSVQKENVLLEDANITHYCIITIIDKGRSEECVKSAKDAGARGGTIIHGHGAGVPTDYYFPLVIEPQKEIVLILTPKDIYKTVASRIHNDLELDKLGNGIIFALPVIKSSGLVEDRQEERKGASI